MGLLSEPSNAVLFLLSKMEKGSPTIPLNNIGELRNSIPDLGKRLASAVGQVAMLWAEYQEP